MVHRVILAASAIFVMHCVVSAQRPTLDGVNEVLAVVNGRAVTYREIVSSVDMQAEINALRAMGAVPAGATDAEIEQVLVFRRLEGVVLERVLDDEADRLRIRIPEAQVRALLRRERRALGLDEDDTRGWARYLRDRFNLSPGEYRQRRMSDLRRNQLLWMMAGAHGSLPPQYPLEIYFALSVTPSELRREFDKDREQYRVSRNIDHRVFRLLYPQDISFENRGKLINAATDPRTGVRARVMRGETLDSATRELRQLITELSIPGARVEVSERQVAASDSELDPVVYDMAMIEMSPRGDVSEYGRASDEDEDGTQYEGVMFVQLFSREDGDLRNFEDPNVQQAIRERLFSRRLVANRQQVERALLARAALVPERLVTR
jgi:hypothetical protein